MSGATPLFPHMLSWHRNNFTTHKFSIFCRSITTQNFKTLHQVVLLCSHFISSHSHYVGTTNDTKLWSVTVKMPLRGWHSIKFDKIWHRVSRLADPEHHHIIQLNSLITKGKRLKVQYCCMQNARISQQCCGRSKSSGLLHHVNW